MRGWRWLHNNIGFDRTVLWELQECLPSMYAPFDMRQSPKDRFRHIDNPKGMLKVFQKRLSQWLGRECVTLLHPCLHGGVKGRSPRTAVTPHVGQRCVATLDIEDYFPSVSFNAVRSFFEADLDFSPPLAECVSRLTTRGEHLPHGAPTSTVLANLVNRRMFTALAHHAYRMGCAITGFVDDIIISGNRAESCVNGATAILNDFHYRLKRAKLHVMHSTQEQEALGMQLNDKIGLPEAKKQALDGMIGGILASGYVNRSELQYFLKYCAYLTSIDPAHTAKVVDQLEKQVLPLPRRAGQNRWKPPMETRPCRDPRECRGNAHVLAHSTLR